MATRKKTGSKSPKKKGVTKASARKAGAKKTSAPRKKARKASAASGVQAVPRAHQGRTKPETLRLKSVTPSLTVDDLGKSLVFYTEALGFFVGESWTDGDVLRGVMLKAGACELGLSQDDWKQGKDRKKGAGFRVWCDTAQNIDAVAFRVKAAGFALTEEPADHPAWGVRSFSVDDPDGFHLTIARNL
jgi:catechol 2,3-dioxygenase-like lactoylglutathione lyase family enzyme